MKIIIKHKTKMVLLVTLYLSLVGCSTKPKGVVVMESDPAIKQLVAVAKDIAEHEKRLYQIESARYFEAGGKSIAGVDMSFLPSLDQYYQLGDQWSGPIEPLLEKISEISKLPVRQ